MPRVTVCVASFNKEDFIRTTLESIRRQTFQDFELIVVDDCSSDLSVQVIEEWIDEHRTPCRFIKHHTNYGVCKLANEVLGMAKGKYLVALAADDVWLPTFLERYVRRFDELPHDVAVLYGDVEMIDEQGRVVRTAEKAHHRTLPRPPEGSVFKYLVRNNFIPAPAAMMRAEWVRAVGGWDPTLYHEDQDMWWKLAQRYSFAFLPETLVQYRRHAGAMSRTEEGMLRIQQSQILIERKWKGLDPNLDRFFDDRLDAWPRVEALWAARDPEARQHAVRALRKEPSARGLLALVCIFGRVPFRCFRVAGHAVAACGDLVTWPGLRSR